jgi:hypothetical protein
MIANFLWSHVIPVRWLYAGGWRQRIAQACYGAAWYRAERKAGRA